MLLLFFASSLCKLFCVSSAIIDLSYHIILLSYHPRFDSYSQTIPRKYPGQNISIKSICRLDLVRYIMRRCKTEKERRRFLFCFLFCLFFSLNPRQKWGEKKNKQTAMSCQNCSVRSSYCHLPDQSHHHKTAWLFKFPIFMQSSGQQLQNDVIQKLLQGKFAMEAMNVIY